MTLLLKLVCNLVQIIVGFYWAGDMARQNPRIDALVTHFENEYGSLNAKLKDARLADGLMTLRRLYGWVAVATCLLFFGLPKLVGPAPDIFRCLSLVTIGSTFGWFSIKWCIDHKKTVWETSRQAALPVFGPLVLGAMDYVFGTSITQAIADGFYNLPLPFMRGLPHLTNPMAIGTITSLLFAAFFAVYYLLTWLLAAPVAIMSAMVVLLPVMLARFAHTLAPRKPFIGFTFVLFAAATLMSLWL